MGKRKENKKRKRINRMKRRRTELLFRMWLVSALQSKVDLMEIKLPLLVLLDIS